MTTNKISIKPKTSNKVWSSLKARDARSKLKKREIALREMFKNVKCEHLFENLLECNELDEFKKLIPKINKFKSNISKAVSNGYIIEDEQVNLEKQKKIEKENDYDEELLFRLKSHMGEGRKAKKFKYDFESKSLFNKQLIKLYPTDFLSSHRVRNTLKKLYDSIDISDFELTQKDVDKIQPKELNDKEWNIQQKKIEQEQQEQKKIEQEQQEQKKIEQQEQKKIEQEQQEQKKIEQQEQKKIEQQEQKKIEQKQKEQEQKQKEQEQEQKEQEQEQEQEQQKRKEQEQEQKKIEQKEDEDEDDDEDEPIQCKNLSLRTIIMRKNKCLAKYREAKKELSELLPISFEEIEHHTTLKANKIQCKSDYRKYKSMEENFQKELSDNFENSDSDSDIIPISARYCDDYTLEIVDLNKLARIGLSSFQAKKGKHMKKYSSAEKLQISSELSEYIPKLEIFRDMEFKDKKQRRKAFNILINQWKKGRGEIKKFKLLVEASDKNSELVLDLLEDEYKFQVKKKVNM
jgi:hypothetical protein